MNHTLQRVVDAATVGAGLSAPWWVGYTTQWLGWLAAIFAALLAIGRFWMFVRDWRNGKRPDE